MESNNRPDYLKGRRLEFGFTSWFSPAVSLPQAFRYISSAGCKSVEIAAMPGYLSRERLIAHALRESGLEPTAISLGIPFLRDPRLSLHSKDLTKRRKSIDYVNAAMDLASGLGVEVVYFCSLRREPGESSRSALVSFKHSVSECTEHAEKIGTTLALEPHPGGEVPRFDAAISLVREIGSRRLGVLLDTGHLAISGEPIGSAVTNSKRTLKHVHINNNDGISDLHWPPYRGILKADDLRSFLRVLSGSGYGGRVSVELSRPRPIEKTIKRSLGYLEGLTANPN